MDRIAKDTVPKLFGLATQSQLVTYNNYLSQLTKAYGNKYTTNNVLGYMNSQLASAMAPIVLQVGKFMRLH